MKINYDKYPGYLDLEFITPSNIPTVTIPTQPPVPNQEVLDELVAETNAGRLDPIQSAQFAVELGYVLIGSVKSSWMYNPNDYEQEPVFYKEAALNDGSWHESEGAYEKRGKLHAHYSARTALLGALFGDPFNRSEHNRRPELAQLRGEIAEPHFGWVSNWPISYRAMSINVQPELQSIAQRERFSGAIDVLWQGPSFDEEGLLITTTSEAQLTRGSFVVSAANLPFDVTTKPAAAPGNYEWFIERRREMFRNVVGLYE